MFAILNDKDGRFVKKINLEKFTRQSSLLGALGVSLIRLSVWASQNGHGRRFHKTPCVFIVFNKNEANLLKTIGKLLGFASASIETNPRHKYVVQSVLRLLIEDVRIRLGLIKSDYVSATYLPLSRGQYLPAIGIVFSDDVPEGGWQ